MDDSNLRDVPSESVVDSYVEHLQKKYLIGKVCLSIVYVFYLLFYLKPEKFLNLTFLS